ncbi:MAG TPA: hypothetical protein VFW47_18055 [Phenylobacterium sp.]|nr:hypothetical protein [Phenylobacterium sp.]
MALVVACASGPPAFAQSAPADAAAADTAAVAAVLSSPSGPSLLSDQSMEAESAQGVVASALSDQQLSAANSGNSVTAATMRTGDVAFSTSALTGFTGVGNFVINTGNNSNLQGTISVNIVTSGPQ